MTLKLASTRRPKLDTKKDDITKTTAPLQQHDKKMKRLQRSQSPWKDCSLVMVCTEFIDDI